jgi:hypothetical protein
MSFSILLSNEWLLPLATVISLASIAVFAFSKAHRNALVNRLRIRRRRTSGASTPPRSFSPNLKSLGETDKKEPPPSVLGFDFVRTFPPSRRSALLELSETASPSKEGILIGAEPSLDVLQEDALPTTSSYNLDHGSAKYTPTGFSVAEIKALGDFPAYDTLSGVPLPQPYENFDPAKALPRPYRPFRWTYHQTMGKTQSSMAILRCVLIQDQL